METTQSTSSSNGKLIALAIVVAGLVIAGAIVYQPGQGTSFQGNALDVAGTAAKPEVSVDDDSVLGNFDAPVTVVIFGDYECPYCKKMFDESEVRLRDKYVTAGTVRFVYRDYPLDSIHPYARAAAEAAQCAQPQGKYWPYHDALFTNQDKLATIDYVALAGTLGLNTEQFSQCIENKTYAAEVQADLEDGMKLGIEGTPATFINGTFIEGAYPYATFEKAIEGALKQ